ncbi:hypothetical protein BS47DRAFT_1374379 [Hydnum rufescens UP504]|uniref:Uncharacterized protein n=1 Tax=Hydnum rufescens UP504 TaxID=1448309 RepID=A0A9P6AER0_9AGAM|nr:hypothetical protein BS47DRAFT_1374379 [Hydnum rufescens UP504]
MGVLEKDGVILAVEKKVTGKLSDVSIAKEGGYGCSGENIFLLNNNVVAGVAAAQSHVFSFNEDILIEQLAQWLCDLKQGYTQYGKATCINVNNLKQECKDSLSMEEAITLMINIMSKTMDSTTLSIRKLEFLILTLGPMTKQLLAKIYK